MAETEIMSEQKSVLLSLLCGFSLVLVWSAIHPHHYFIWILGGFPALLALAVLAVTYPKFPSTTLVYGLCFDFRACLHTGKRGS